MKKSISILALAFLTSSFAANMFAQCSFTSSTNNTCRTTAILFTNTSTAPGAYRLDWDFWDGTPTYTTTVATNTVSHTFAGTGNYNVSLNVYDISGFSLCSSNMNISIGGLGGINVPDSICPGEMANMCAQSSQGGNFSTFWKFGDGATYNSNQQCANHAYSSQNSYTITVIAAAGGCPTDSSKKKVVVHPNAKPNAGWGYWNGAQSPFCPNQAIGFSTSPAASYSWNFGDGGTSNLQQPSHTYTTVNTYSVTLSKTNSCGNTSTYTNTVVISNTVGFPNQPWFYLQVNGTPACPNTPVNFKAPNGYGTYEWNFGDGTPVSTGSISDNNHSYATANTYTASVKITNGCNKDTTLYKPVQISLTAPFPNQSWFQINSSSPSCPNSQAQFEGPDGFVSYQWNFGDGSALVTSADRWTDHTYGSALTTYTVSVKITNGCGNDTTIYSMMQILSNVGFANSNLTVYVNNPNCISNPVSMYVQGGYSDFYWEFGDGATASTTKDGAEHTYTLAGTYNASVTITNGCGNDTTVAFSVVVDGTGSFPNGSGSNLNIEVNPQNGQSCPNDIVSFNIWSGSYSSYEWNFGDGTIVTSTGSEIQHSYTTTGTYPVSCKITNGCALSTTVYASVSVSATAPVNPSLYVSSIQNPACIGDKVYMIPQEGQVTYTYYWNFGDGGKDTTFGVGAIHAFTTNGNHTVTVTAKNGCGLLKTITFVDTIKSNAKPSLIQSNGDPIWGIPGGEGSSSFTAGCAGDAIIFYFMGEAASNSWNFGDGNIGSATEHIVVSGGDGNSYPVTIIKHAYAANGTYTVSLTLTNNCGNSVSDTMDITIGGNLQVSGDMSTSPPPFTTCAPIDFIGFGGASYLWNFGDGNTLNSTSPTVSHTYATQGVYVATVLITNGCGSSDSYSKSVNVTGVGGPAIVLTGSVIPTCLNSSNGSATINVTSGQLPYTYLWNDVNSQTTASATGLHAGLYNVIVTDGFGCPSNLVVQLNDPAPVVLTTSTTKTNCGAATGSATVTVTSGGTAPYFYNWSNGSTTSSAIALSYGMYNVQVTDSKGCSASSNVSVSEVNGATVSLGSVTNILCNSGSNGSINITVSGGNPPYQYAWSNGSTAQNPSGLSAGTYSVLITDNSSCKATFNASVSQPSAIVASTSVVTAPTCGNFDGKASVSATGGTGAYTYAWDANTGSQTTQTATGLPAGSYSVTIRDANACSATTIISLSNSNAPLLSAAVSDVSCFGGSNGSVDLSVTGGTSPYLYTWNVGPPQTNNQDIFGLAPGTYVVSVNDKMGCLSFQLYTVNQPALLSATVTNTGATCGNNDGTATAAVSGGNTPYSYLWTGGLTSQSIGSLALGNYTVGITDGKGCKTSGSTTVTATAMPVNICGITVDNTSTKNVIVWEKPAATNIDSFKIYRLISAAYTYIGHRAYTDSSYFVDNTNGVNPNTAAYKYELRMRDICGTESVLSPLHQTIHLQVGVAAPPNSFNLSWNDYLGFPVTQYRIMVDSLNNGNWFARDSVPYGNPLTWTDSHHYIDTVNYMIEIAHPTGCVVSIKNPEVLASNLNLSKSNINRVKDTTGGGWVKDIANEVALALYPNPNNGIFTIDIKEQVKGSIKIKVFNMLGAEVKSAAITGNRNKFVMDLSKQPKGVYYVEIMSDQKKTTKKIIIE